MTKTSIRNHPYWAAIIAAIICTFFTSVGVAAAQITKAEGADVYAIYTVGAALSVLTGWGLIRLSPFSLMEIGFRRSRPGSARQVLIYTPLLLMETVPLLLYGPVFPEAPSYYGVIALFTLMVGLNEELYFRGIIQSIVGQKGLRHAIWGSAVIFGLLHIANAFSSEANLTYVLIQIAYAFLVGLVLALIVRLTGSLWIVILWHGAHDFLAFSIEKGLDTTALIGISLQVLILLVYAIVLWKKAAAAEQRHTEDLPSQQPPAVNV